MNWIFFDFYRSISVLSVQYAGNRDKKVIAKNHKPLRLHLSARKKIVLLGLIAAPWPAGIALCRHLRQNDIDAVNAANVPPACGALLDVRL